MRTAAEEGRTVFYPEGRIDSGNAGAFEAEVIAGLAARPGTQPVLDFRDLRYISSAGLRVLMKIIKRSPEKILIRNVSPEIYDILEVTGISTVVNAERRLRELSVEGLRPIGWGGYGAVYRIDDDTIVKVYDNADAVEMIENEQRMARYAFLRGLPTAISYDRVKVGDRFGSVFEMIQARTMNDYLIDAKCREEEEALCRMHAGLVRMIGEAEAEPGDLPDARDIYLRYLEMTREYYPAGYVEKLRKLISVMPENRHLIHGDLHLKNVMLSDGEPILIDMETLCTGDPVFEYVGLLIAYKLFSEDEPEDCRTFMGMAPEKGERFWKKSLEFFLEGFPPQRRRAAVDSIELLGRMHFLYKVAVKRNGREAYRQLRIEHTIEHLGELLDRVESLAIAE